MSAIPTLGESGDIADAQVAPLHDDAAEWYYFLQGNGWVTVGDETQEVGPGTAVYIPIGEKHNIVNSNKEMMVVLFGYNKPKFNLIYDE